MKRHLPPVLLLLVWFNLTLAQDGEIKPSCVVEGVYLGETKALRDLPTLSSEEWQMMSDRAETKLLNPKMRVRSHPFAETALPKGPDPVWQKEMFASRESREPEIILEGQNSPYYPPDANGTAGPNHYMHTINTVYTIYSKTGEVLAGPTALNTLFNGVPGSNYNNGDPIVLYDEQADRWLVSEFSISGANDYLLVAVSTSPDPTGTWHAYSFDVADMPDYPKFGIWRDGYYLATNNSNGNDIYVFQRSTMLVGETTMGVGFNNPWRPVTNDGFMCVPPVDNDGAFAPIGSPGIFITINDDAIGGGNDQLWIYELNVDWAAPSNSTFTRTQMINVAPFDSNFGNTWENIDQPDTPRKLDAVPQVVMNPPQYRNFGTYETIVCCHTVDVDATNHAGIRWYELRRTGGDWSIRQQGTYAPDEHSRWLGSIMLNGNGEIGLGYSISSTTLYPGIRYCGQSIQAYMAATGVMDVPEEIIHLGSYPQVASNRWGDYSSLQVDPVDDETFWFTSQYIGVNGTRKTKIASFDIPDSPGKWKGEISSAWDDPANWSDGLVPGPEVDVYISQVSPNWPVFSGNFMTGNHCRNLYLLNESQFSVTGDLIINQGSKIEIRNNGHIATGGNWLNNGVFKEGYGSVELNGAVLASIGRGHSGNLNNIALSTFFQTMVPLTNGNIGPTGDNGFATVPIGFTFSYAGIDYTQLNISTNGYITLNLSGGITNINNYLFTSSEPNTTLAPWFDDLKDDELSTVTYKTEGAEPNRVFTVEWNNLLTYRTNATTRITFQAKLYEGSNVIEFIYGGRVMGSNSANESASIGIEDLAGGSGHFIEATTGSRTEGIVTLVSTTDWPQANFRFTPPTPWQVFHNLTINNPGGYLYLDANLKITGLFLLMSGSTFRVTQGKSLDLEE